MGVPPMHRYLESMGDYLAGYLERTQPLVDQHALLGQIKKDFTEKWTKGTFPGWKASYVVLITALPFWEEGMYSKQNA